MLDDVDLFRVLMLRLELKQLSPRAAVVVSAQDEAAALGVGTGQVAAALDLLQELDYIDGPGADEDGLWLFRKLTRKGIRFVGAARDLDDWAEIKRRQSGRSWLRDT